MAMVTPENVARSPHADRNGFLQGLERPAALRSVSETGPGKVSPGLSYAA